MGESNFSDFPIFEKFRENDFILLKKFIYQNSNSCFHERVHSVESPEIVCHSDFTWNQSLKKQQLSTVFLLWSLIWVNSTNFWKEFKKKDGIDTHCEKLWNFTATIFSHKFCQINVICKLIWRKKLRDSEFFILPHCVTVKNSKLPHYTVFSF